VDVDVLVSGPEANAEYKAARTDLLATIARHITPAPPSDAELREAVERCKLYIDDFRLVGDTTTAAAISTVLRAVQAPASGETDAGLRGCLMHLKSALLMWRLSADGRAKKPANVYALKLDAARTAVIAEHNRAIAAAYEDALKECTAIEADSVAFRKPRGVNGPGFQCYEFGVQRCIIAIRARGRHC
jgi:hypothetical protein